jgi:hypothetical protein
MDAFINSVDLFQSHTGAKFYKQRGIKRGFGVKTRIPKEILHVHVLCYLCNGFTVIQVTHVFNDQRPYYNPWAYRRSAGTTYTDLPGINIADIIPRDLPCQNNPPVRPAQLL